MLWDEDNRLLSVSDNGYVSNYWYNASGERTVKMSKHINIGSQRVLSKLCSSGSMGSATIIPKLSKLE